MIQKKICMLGSFAVGKTSLVQRFVKSIFSDKYLTTVGVKIDKKMMEAGGKSVMLMLWDLEGEDEFHTLKISYLRGAAGYFLVADGTRRETLDVAVDIHMRAKEVLGDVPFILLVNKCDLESLWEVDEQALADLKDIGVDVRFTSAKLGQGVEDAFTDLATAMVERMG